MRKKVHDVVIYTDALTPTAILGSAAIDVRKFARGNSFAETFSEAADKDWGTIFNDTTLIYGIEMLAAVAPIFALMGFTQGKNAVFCDGNFNTKDSLVKGQSDTRAIDVLIKIFWEFAQSPGDWVWIENVASNRRISDLPDREAPPPSPLRRDLVSEFPTFIRNGLPIQTKLLTFYFLRNPITRQAVSGYTLSRDYLKLLGKCVMFDAEDPFY